MSCSSALVGNGVRLLRDANGLSRRAETHRREGRRTKEFALVHGTHTVDSSANWRLATVAGLVLATASGWIGCGAEEAGTDAATNARPEIVPVDVLVVSPVRQELTRQITLPANVAAFATTTLMSRVSGYLATIGVDIGDTVRRGQLVARIDVPELEDQLREAEAKLRTTRADHAKAKAELQRAQAELDLRRVTHERIQAVRTEEPDLMPQQTLDEASARLELASGAVDVSRGSIQQIEGAISQGEAAVERLRTLVGFAEIRAPFDGIVTQRYVDPGTLLQAQTSSHEVQQIITLANIDRVRLRLDVPEAEVPYVQTGDGVTVRMDALPGRPFEGRVTRFAGVLDPATRTMWTEVHLPNPSLTLRPGMYGQALLSLDTNPDAITVPADALRVDGETPFVYCVVNGVAKRFNVTTSLGDGTVVEVVEGLDGHENVVVTGRGPIVDGTVVNAMRMEDEEPR